MNKLVVHQSADYSKSKNFFHPTFVSVESVTDEGAPYTFAVIYRSKHKRSNLVRPGRNGDFMAGGRGQRAVEKYARTVDPNTTEQYFIEARGKLRQVNTKPFTIEEIK